MAEEKKKKKKEKKAHTKTAPEFAVKKYRYFKTLKPIYDDRLFSNFRELKFNF